MSMQTRTWNLIFSLFICSASAEVQGEDPMPVPLQFSRQPALLKIGVQEAIQIPVQKKVRVAILDTGIAASLRYLSDRVPSDLTARERKLLGSCFDGSIEDDQGHGSRVATLVASVAGESEILPIRISGAEKGASPAAMACGVDVAIRLGARVINVSKGSAKMSDELKEKFKQLEDRGIVVVAAAGNELVDRDKTPIFPASLPFSNVIAVSATDLKDRHLWLYPDNWDGSASYGRNSVHVSAPGALIVLPIVGEEDQLKTSATSWTAAMVSGVVARGLEKNPTISPRELREKLMKTSAPIQLDHQTKVNPILSGRVDMVSFLAEL
jgi:subtilisin family serine protease